MKVMLRLSLLRTVVCLTLLAPVSYAGAQLTNKDAPIIAGHYHINSADIDARDEVLGRHARRRHIKFGPQQVDVVEFPGIFLFFRKQAPTARRAAPRSITSVLPCPNVAEVAAQAVANGYQRTVGREPGPGQTAAPPTAGNYGKFEYLIGPDGVKVELVTNNEPNAPPIKHHHMHFVNKQFVEMEQWYMKAFNATLRPGRQTSSSAPICRASATC